MKSYLKEMSVGEAIDGSVRLYVRHFPTIFLIYLLPLFAVELMLIALWPNADPEVHSWVALLVSMPAIIPASGATVVAVSEITLGHKPRVARAYGRVLAVFGRFLWTYLLVAIVFIVGLLLLVLPGIFALTVLMFATTAVMLERRGGWDALKRSASLGKGYYWRNLLALALIMILIFVGHMILWIIVGMTVFALGDPNQLGIAARIIVAAVSNLFTPIVMILVTLLYYDMRVRKENYDTATLAQDLVG
jgi:hypothetical protein